MFSLAKFMSQLLLRYVAFVNFVYSKPTQSLRIKVLAVEVLLVRVSGSKSREIDQTSRANERVKERRRKELKLTESFERASESRRAE